MPIDPSIALGVRPLEVANPLNQLAQVSQIQSAQRQGEVAQMQLEQLKQDRDEMTKLQQDLIAKGGSPDLRALATTLLKSPKHVAQGIELLQKLDEQDKYEGVLKKLYGGGAAAAPAAAPMAPAMPGTLGSGTFGAMPAPAAANALAPAPAAPAAPANALVNQPNSATDLEGKIAMLAPFASRPGVKEQIAGLQAQLTELRKPIVAAAGSTIYGPSGNIIANVPAQPTELQRNYQYAKSQGFPGSIFDYEREIKLASRTPAQPTAPVAVVDESGKTRYVSREEAISKGMTPANAFEGLTPKEIQKREAALPQAKSSVTSFETKTDQFIKELMALRDDPGLNQITGPIYGRTPSVSREGSRAQALYNKIFAKGGFQGLQDLREASKTGGALGNVSNEEGRRLEASVVGGLDRTQNIEDVKAGINDLIDSLNVSKTRVRNTFDETYQYKSGRGPAAPAAPDPLGIR
jgi:hypothetical protein